MKIYLSGPMTGLPGLNAAAFREAQARLEAIGYEVVNPHDIPCSGQDPQWADYMRADLLALLNCDEICLLPGWHLSKGASLEAKIAETLGMRCRTLDDMTDVC